VHKGRASSAPAAMFLAAASLAGCGPADSLQDDERELAEVEAIVQEIQRDVVNLSHDTSRHVNVLWNYLGGAPWMFGLVVNLTSWESCGVTFVSKHYAITAAHCVKNVALDSPELIVASVNFSVGESTFENSTIITGGTYPDWTPPPPLTFQDGYHIKGSWCQVTWRCHDGTGSPSGQSFGTKRCPPYPGEGVGNQIDLALLYCPQRPEPKIFLTVHPENHEQVGHSVEVYWFHEVVKLQRWAGDSQNNSPANNWNNYGSGANPNYRFDNLLGHTYIPLVSKTWDAAHGSVNYTVTNTQGYHWSDVPVCAGTSGSGTFVNGSTALSGPVWLGQSFAGLCHPWDSSATVGYPYTSFLSAQQTRPLEASFVKNDR
jgi:hypothetical protein